MFRAASALLIALALSSGPALAQGDYEKNQVEYKLKSIDEAMGQVLDRFARYKEDGKYEDETKRQNVMEDANGVFDGLADVWVKAVAAGTPAADPAMADAKGRLEAMTAKLEPLGFWTCWRLDEPRIYEITQLDTVRRNAALAEWLASTGKIEEAKASWVNIDRHLGQLVKASKDKAEDPRSQATVGLDQLVPYQRTKAEVERLRAATDVWYQQLEAKRVKVAEEWVALKAALDSIQLAGGGTLRNVLQYGSSCTGEDLDKVLEFEGGLKGQVEKTMADFASKYPTKDKGSFYEFRHALYGDYWSEFQKRFKIEEDLIAVYQELGRLVASPAEIHRVCAGRLADQIGTELKAAAPDFAKAKEKLALGLRFDAGNADLAKAKEALAGH